MKSVCSVLQPWHNINMNAIQVVFYFIPFLVENSLTSINLNKYRTNAIWWPHTSLEILRCKTHIYINFCDVVQFYSLCYCIDSQFSAISTIKCCIFKKITLFPAHIKFSPNHSTIPRQQCLV